MSLTEHVLSPGDVVVHPHHGALVFGGVETRSFDGETRRYLVLHSGRGSLTILAPTTGSADIGLRSPVSRATALQVLEVLAGEPEAVPAWSGRGFREMCRKAGSGEPRLVAEVVRDLAGKERRRRATGGRDLSPSERRLMRSSIEILVAELAVALRISESRAKERVARALDGPDR